jgi:hypothetical protein
LIKVDPEPATAVVVVVELDVVETVVVTPSTVVVVVVELGVVGEPLHLRAAKAIPIRRGSATVRVRRGPIMLYISRQPRPSGWGEPCI